MMLEHWSGWLFAYGMSGLFIFIFGAMATTNSDFDHPIEKGIVALMVIFAWWLMLAMLIIGGALWVLGWLAGDLPVKVVRR